MKISGRSGAKLGDHTQFEGFSVIYRVLLPVWMGAVGWNLYRLGRSNGLTHHRDDLGALGELAAGRTGHDTGGLDAGRGRWRCRPLPGDGAARIGSDRTHALVSALSRPRHRESEPR